ncbi:MAG: hypothetical protein HXX11_12195 [Desulfuromonadales bacterium]|nr:hypothetical protein [Desulfuromonadales bacterium]
MNRMGLSTYLQKMVLFIIAAVILVTVGSASAAVKPRQGADMLLDSYRRYSARLATNSYGLPLVVESSEQEDRVQVDVYGIFDHSFIGIANALKVPANWCDIVFLPPNIKTCTYRKLNDTWQLAFYLGRKEYQPPEDARKIICRYRSVEQQQGYLDIMLNADDGPFGTKNHRMRTEALPLDGGKTFIHVSYTYSDSVALRLASKIYFATLGRSKVGFTVTGTDRNGKQIHIGGPRGAVERNAVRYFFAIQSFMNTSRYPEESRFNLRISQWYDLTNHYRKQLFDLEKKDYITLKTRERRNQVTLQNQIETGR